MAEAVRPKKVKKKENISSVAFLDRLNKLEIISTNEPLNTNQTLQSKDSCHSEHSKGDDIKENEDDTKQNVYCDQLSDAPETLAPYSVIVPEDETSTSVVADSDSVSPVLVPEAIHVDSVQIDKPDPCEDNPVKEDQGLHSIELELPDFTPESCRAAQKLYPSIEQLEADLEVSENYQPGIEPTAPPLFSLTGQVHLDSGLAVEHGNQWQNDEERDVEMTLPEPLSDGQFRSLYHNEILDRLEEFETSFINQFFDVSHHPLYNLLANYQSTMQLFRQGQGKTEDMIKETDRIRGQVWQITKHDGTQQGRCVDGYYVTGRFSYETAHPNEDYLKNLSVALADARQEMVVEVPLRAYESLLARHLIENFLFKLYDRLPLFKNIPKNAPAKIVQEDELGHSGVLQIQEMQGCLAVLFAFMRKPNLDADIHKDLRDWTLRLGGSLLRCGRSFDHLSLMAQLLRCPAGVGTWGACLVQPVLGPPDDDTDFHDAMAFHHTLAMLALICRPIKDRVRFLAGLRALLSPSTSQSEDDPKWVLVDSEGEEDPEPQEIWHRLHETDLINIIVQVGLPQLYSHLLKTSREMVYSSTSGRLLRVMAFNERLIGIIQQGLLVYAQGKFTRLHKTLNRMIKHSLQFLTDHMEISMNQLATSGTSDVQTMHSLQAQYESVFLKGCANLVEAGTRLQVRSSSHGVWEALADCPFRLFTAQGKRQMLNLIVSRGSNYYSKDKKTPDLTVLEDWLSELAQEDALYVLRTLSNIARDCHPWEKKVVNKIVTGIFKLCFLSDSTRSICSKAGQELLPLIAHKHPHILVYLVNAVKKHMDDLEQIAMHLFRELPFHLFYPSEGHMILLSNWLINYPLTSLANQLARIVFENLNWGFVPNNPGQLFLPLEMHRNMANLLVKAFRVHHSQKQSSWLISEGRKMWTLALWLTGSSTAGSPEKSFPGWCLALVVHLRLHYSSRSLSHPSASHLTELDALSAWDTLDLTGDAVWKSMLEEARSNVNPVATYAALVISDWGHKLVDGFLNGGVKLLNGLCCAQQQYRLGFEALNQIIKMFGRQEHLLLASDSFMSLLRAMIHADEGPISSVIPSREFPGPVLNMFTMMVLNLCEPTEALIMFPDSGSMRRFWLRALLSQADWYSDRCLLYLLNKLLLLNFRLSTGPDDDIGEEEMNAAYQTYSNQCITVWQTRSGFSSMLPLGSYLPSLVDNLSDPNACPWLVLYLCRAEMKAEDQLGLWETLQRHLDAQAAAGLDTVNVNTALELTLKDIHFPMNYSVERLSIYVLMRSINALKPDQSVLPLIIQLFFTRYFALPPHSRCSSITSSGLHLFSSRAHSYWLKQLRQSLTSASNHHGHWYTETISSTSSSEPLSFSSIQSLEDLATHRRIAYHGVMAKILETFVLWIDEPRLHQGKLDMRSLPRQYYANRLLAARNRHKENWVDLLDVVEMDESITEVIRPWKQRSVKKRSVDRVDPSLIENRVPVSERIVLRLERQGSHLDPPEGVTLKPLVSDPDPSSLLDQRLLIYSIQEAMHIVGRHAKSFKDRAQTQSHLDDQLEKMVVQLYENYQVQISIDVPCHAESILPGVIARTCKGAAHIVVKHLTYRLVDAVKNKIADNRTEYKQLIIKALQAAPYDVIKTVLQLEHVITCLVTSYKKSSKERSLDTGCLHQSGVALFYHLAGIMTEDIRSYPPAESMISKSMQMLGSVFVYSHLNQLENLVKYSLQSPYLLPYLTPHLHPNTAPELFVTLYKRLVTSPQSFTHLMLAKFDVSDWLTSYGPPIHQRDSLAQTICEAAGACGNDDEDSHTEPLLQLYRSHLEAILNYDLANHFTLVMKTLFNCVAIQDRLPISCWKSVVICLHNDIETTGEISLSTEKLEDILEQLSSALFDQRSSNQNMMSSGLFIKWGRYAKELATILSILLHAVITKLTRAAKNGHYKLPETVDRMWRLITLSLGPWIEPIALPTPCQYGLGWTNLHAEEAEYFLITMRESLSFAHQAIQDCSEMAESTCIQSRVWKWYSSSLAISGVGSTLLIPLHHHLLQLSWQSWILSASNLNFILEFHNTQVLNECREFLIRILARANYPVLWPNFVPPPGYLDALFKIVVGLLSRHEVNQLPDAALLLDRLAMLPSWSSLSGNQYKLASDWLMTKAEPHIILKEITSTDGKFLSLLARAGDVPPGISSIPDSPTSKDSLDKQLVYTRVAMTLLAHCASRPDLDTDKFKVKITNILAQIESTLSAVHPSSIRPQHGINLARQCLCLLSNTSAEGLRLSLSILVSWVENAGTSPLTLPIIAAAGRYSPSPQIAATLMDKAIRSYLLSDSCSGALIDWNILMGYFQLDDSSANDILTEACQSGYVLVLYVRVCQRLPRAFVVKGDVSGLTRQVRDWVIDISNKECPEEGILLLWERCIHLLLCEVSIPHVTMVTTVGHLNALVAMWTALAEERNSTGLLGRVGFGRKSQHSPEFRFISRVLSVFLNAQMPTGGVSTLRLFSEAPGHLTLGITVQTRPPGDVLPTNQAIQAINQLEALKRNSSYSAPVYSNLIGYCLDFVGNPANCLLQTRDLLIHIIGQLYPDSKMLRVVTSSS